MAEIIVISQRGTAQADASAINFDEIRTDEDFLRDTSLFNTFGANFAVSSAGNAVSNTGSVVSNTSDTTLSTTVQVTRTSSEVRVVGSSAMSSNSDISPNAPIGPFGPAAGGVAVMEISIDVTGGPATAVFEMNAQQASASGFGTGANDAASVTFVADGALEGSFLGCSAGGCASASPFTRTAVLVPGRYFFRVDTNTIADRVGTASASCSYSLVVAQSECDLTWNESGAGGAFGDAENWSPQQAPQDDGNGCSDLLLDQPGAFTLTYGAGAEADSIKILQGEPTLQGGSLTLAGFDDTALTLDGNAILNVTGTLTADDALLNGQSLLATSGPLTFDVLGDLTLAPLPGDGASMLLAATGDDPEVDTVNLKVAGNWNLGGAGATASTLQGRTAGTARNVRLGGQTGGVGILNILEGASLSVAEELRIGLAGVGKLVVNTQGEVSADTVLVSGPAGEDTSELTIGNGGSLTVTTTLESGRAANERGEIRIGDSAPESDDDSTASLSVVGDMILAGAGGSLLSGAGPLQLDVLGDLSMAVFPGSDSSLVIGVISDEPSDDGEPTDAANLVVAGTWTVGGAGAAAATLADQTDATVKALRLGQLGDGIGILNVTEGASLEVTEDALVGGAGVGTLNISNVGTFSAVNLTVDGAAGEEISGLRLSGESGGIPAEADIALNLVVGNATSGLWDMFGSARLDAGIITLGSASGATGSASLVGASELTGGELQVSAVESMFVGLDGDGSYASAGLADQQFGEVSIGVNQGSTGSYFATGGLNFTTIQQDIVVGGAGTGDLELRAGGVTTGACILGAQNGGFGALRVFQGGALVIAPPASVEGEVEGEGKHAEKTSISFPGFLEIGRKANGIIELFDAGTRLACDETIIGGDNAAAGGTLNVDTGASVDCSVSLTLGANTGPGLVRVADEATMNVGSSIIIGPQGLFIAGGGASITSGNVVVNGRLRVVNGLRIERPEGDAEALESTKGGDSPTLIEGKLEVGSNGTLDVIAGAGVALVVTGAATLGGTLDITLPPGSTFTDGQLLDLINLQGGVTGGFAEITFSNAPDGFEGDVAIDGGALRLRVINGGTVDPEGEGEGDPEGEGEGEGEGEPEVPGGCQGCNPAGGGAEKALGDWLALFLGFVVLLGAHLCLQRQPVRHL